MVTENGELEAAIGDVFVELDRDPRRGTTDAVPQHVAPAVRPRDLGRSRRVRNREKARRRRDAIIKAAVAQRTAAAEPGISRHSIAVHAMNRVSRRCGLPSDVGRAGTLPRWT
jgi:hypothetical protein